MAMLYGDTKIPFIRFNSQQSNIAPTFKQQIEKKNGLICDFLFPEVVSFYTEL